MAMPLGLSSPLAITWNEPRFARAAPSGATDSPTAAASAAANINDLLCMWESSRRCRAGGAANQLYARIAAGATINLRNTNRCATTSHRRDVHAHAPRTADQG